LTEAVHLLLDALAPVGTLGAQVLWVAQPLGSVFGWRDAISDIANALEAPEGIEDLRRRLEND